MKIALAQINCTVGDLAGNAAKILGYADRAKRAGAALLVTPELALCGYPPEDLLLRDGFYAACDAALQKLASSIAGIALLVGHPHRMEDKHYNAASVIRDGKIVATYCKQRLPNYTVFDEQRYFDAGDAPCVFEVAGVKFGINICADIWEPGAATQAHLAGAQVLLALNASPYHLDKQASRYEALRERISETGLAVVYVNLVGGQDELVFDGASFAMNGAGELTHQFAGFAETLGLIDIQNGALQAGEITAPPDPEASVVSNVYSALCLGVKDYVEKNGFPGVLLGLSGGVDSALVLAVAVDALGADKVRAVMMPSQFTSEISLDDARVLAKTLGVRYDELPITQVFDAYLQTLAEEFKGLKTDTTEENIQARIRGTLLMALSNKYGSIVLTTGNKSEMAVGYCTLYGDMAGGFAVLKDVSKTLVYQLCRYRNRVSAVIPQRVLERAPSAELRADQTDQDNLPPYEVLDAIVEAYMENNRSLAEIIDAGVDADDARRVVRLIQINEYKRRQSPVGIRITARGFGKDWRYPITSKYHDEF